MISSEEIGSILTKVALADQGFLILILAAVKMSSCDLPPADLAKLAEWQEHIDTLNERC